MKYIYIYIYIYIYKKKEWNSGDTDSKTKFSVSVFSRFSKYLDSDSLLSPREEPHFVVYLLIYWNSLSGLQSHEVSSILRVFHVKLSCLVLVIAGLGLCYCCIF